MLLRPQYDWTSPQSVRFVVDPAGGQQSMLSAQRKRREERTREWVLRRGSSCHQLIVVFVRG